MAKWTGKRVQVAYDKPKDPSFLTAFKRRTGYREDGGMEDKFAEMPAATLEDLADEDGDLPQVVGSSSSGGGSLSTAECEALEQQGKLQQLLATGAAEQDDQEPSDGKIVFRKPSAKRPLSDSEDAPTVDDSSTAALKQKEKKKKKKKKLEDAKKKKLLSFDDEDDED